MNNLNNLKSKAVLFGAALCVGVSAVASPQIINEPAGGCYGSSISAYLPGLTALGTAVSPERAIQTNALGAPNGITPVANAPVQNFIALGFGGSIELQFANPIANGPGNDIKIWESSASPNSERARIEVSQDGLGYLPVGEISMTGEIDFGVAFPDFVQFVRIVDITVNNGGGQFTDGYDVDAIECLHGEYINPNNCFANEVISFNQKKRNDGTSVDIARSNPTKALGMPENNDTENFVSLGFGGDITLKFGSPIKNGDGDDVRVIESTFGSASGNCVRYPERIRAFASQDGCNFVYLGEGCQDTDFDLGSLAWAQYIKLVDISPVGAAYQGTPIADAYDVDGVMCLNGNEENPVLSDMPIGTATSVIDFTQGMRKNGTPVSASRSNPNNALGLPQGTDVVNFVSLGFGGSIELKFSYVIFDNPDAADIQIVETSYGNPSCAQYGEKVMVEGSLDGVNWITLTDADICLDGMIDINNAGVIQYLRITDHSMASHFSGSADGYDIDGLVVINSCNDLDLEARIKDDVTTIDELTSISAFPNPFASDVRIELTTGEKDHSAVVKVFNFLGQEVYNSSFNVASSSKVVETLQLDGLKSGVYFMTVETTSAKETVRLVKK
jgi:hypothetical protein